MKEVKTGRVPKSKFKRMLSWGWKQRSKTPICPDQPLLTNKIVVLTGGNAGIGLETVKGLLERKAEVIILSRNKEKSQKVIDSLTGKVYFIELDLADITSITEAVNVLKVYLKGRAIDILINNAGIASQGEHCTSPQGYELTFAVNVLGHHVLFTQCHTQSLLASEAKVIAVGGDIYTQAKDCTADFSYEGKGGVAAYARSKVGVMWWAFECHRLFPNYMVNVIHPGVVPLGLASDKSSLIVRLMSKILLPPKGGAQMTLICATQPNIENGAYYHNTIGKAILPEGDIALNVDKSKQFWVMLEQISALHDVDLVDNLKL